MEYAPKIDIFGGLVKFQHALISALITVSISAPGWAKKPEPPFGEKLNLVKLSGKIELTNSKGQVKNVSSLDGAMVAMKVPPFLKNFGRLITGQKMLALKIDDDQYNFFVPGNLIDGLGQFKVHQKYTNQKYHVQFSKSIKDHKSIVSNQRIECSWETLDMRPQIGTDSDGNMTVTMVPDYTTHWGHQQATVDDQTWNEKQVVLIYDEQNQLQAETGFVGKSARRIVKELTSCQ